MAHTDFRLESPYTNMHKSRWGILVDYLTTQLPRPHMPLPLRKNSLTALVNRSLIVGLSLITAIIRVLQYLTQALQQAASDKIRPQTTRQTSTATNGTLRDCQKIV